VHSVSKQFIRDDREYSLVLGRLLLVKLLLQIVDSRSGRPGDKPGEDHDDGNADAQTDAQAEFELLGPPPAGGTLGRVGNVTSRVTEDDELLCYKRVALEVAGLDPEISQLRGRPDCRLGAGDVVLWRGELGQDGLGVEDEGALCVGVGDVLEGGSETTHEAWPGANSVAYSWSI
jgi:hypothetical protein